MPRRTNPVPRMILAIFAPARAGEPAQATPAFASPRARRPPTAPPPAHATGERSDDPDAPVPRNGGTAPRPPAGTPTPSKPCSAPTGPVRRGMQPPSTQRQSAAALQPWRPLQPHQRCPWSTGGRVGRGRRRAAALVSRRTRRRALNPLMLTSLVWYRLPRGAATHSLPRGFAIRRASRRSTERAVRFRKCRRRSATVSMPLAARRAVRKGPMTAAPPSACTPGWPSVLSLRYKEPRMTQVFSSVDTATLVGTTALDPLIGMAFGDTVNVDTELVTADDIIADDIPDDDIQRAARRRGWNAGKPVLRRGVDSDWEEAVRIHGLRARRFPCGTPRSASRRKTGTCASSYHTTSTRTTT